MCDNDGDRNTLPIGSVSSMLAPTLSQGNHYREYYINCRCCWNVATYKWKVHNVTLGKAFYYFIHFINDDGHQVKAKAKLTLDQLS
jgi:hypothetical protein